MNELPVEPIFSGMKNRLLETLARFAPGITTWRVRLHRWRGVRLGTDVHIGADVLLETGFPSWISIGNGVQIGMRSTIIAHYHGLLPKEQALQDYVSVRIEDDVSIGAGVIILPNVTVGRGSVVTAGSVVTSSIPPLTVVQGNPARPIARCGVPLTYKTPLKEFCRKLKPLSAAGASSVASTQSTKGVSLPVPEGYTVSKE